VMVAMAGPTPVLPGVRDTAAFEGEPPVADPVASEEPFTLMDDVLVPAVGPFVPDKPDAGGMVSAYADARIASAYGASAPFRALGLTETRIRASWKSGMPDGAAGEYILLGTFSKAGAARIGAEMNALGEIVREESGPVVTLSLRAPDGADIDKLLEQSWRLGASDAFIVRQ
jgi:rare lipoprotein A